MRTVVDTSDAVTLTLDNGDGAEVVYDRWCEIPVIEIRNHVWVEEPRYLRFVGTSAPRDIDALIDALTKLRDQIRRGEGKGQSSP